MQAVYNFIIALSLLLFINTKLLGEIGKHGSWLLTKSRSWLSLTFFQIFPTR